MRKYRLTVGGPAQWKEIYLKQGYEVQRKYLGEPVGYYLTEFGEINEIIHMWRYESMEDRTAKRAAMIADPKWIEFLLAIRPLVETQTTSILTEVLDK